MASRPDPTFDRTNAEGRDLCTAVQPFETLAHVVEPRPEAGISPRIPWQLLELPGASGAAIGPIPACREGTPSAAVARRRPAAALPAPMQDAAPNRG